MNDVEPFCNNSHCHHENECTFAEHKRLKKTIMKKVMLVIALAGLAIAQVNAQTEPAKMAAPAKKSTEHHASHKSAKAAHQVKKEEKTSTTTMTPATKAAPAPAPAKAAPAPAKK